MPTTAPQVIQLFQLAARLDKSSWREPAVREAALRWPPTVRSRSGFMDDGVVHVPAGVLQGAAHGGAPVLALLDRIPGAGPLDPPLYQAADPAPARPLRPSSSGAALELLQLREGADGLELWLDAARTAEYLGSPRRASFRLAVLSPGDVVRLRLNGKRDLSLTGRRARTYTEVDTVVQHLGMATRVAGLPEPAPPREKRVPLADARVVDLRAALH